MAAAVSRIVRVKLATVRPRLWTATLRAAAARYDADALIFRSLSLQFSRHSSKLIQNYKIHHHVANGLRIILFGECDRTMDDRNNKVFNCLDGTMIHK